MNGISGTFALVVRFKLLLFVEEQSRAPRGWVSEIFARATQTPAQHPIKTKPSPSEEKIA